MGIAHVSNLLSIQLLAPQRATVKYRQTAASVQPDPASVAQQNKRPAVTSTRTSVSEEAQTQHAYAAVPPSVFRRGFLSSSSSRDAFEPISELSSAIIQANVPAVKRLISTGAHLVSFSIAC